MNRPDVIVLMTDEERAAPPYETDEIRAWRRETLRSWEWWDRHAVRFERHYTGSLACVPSRPTLFTGQYPDLHGVTQTDGLGKAADDTRMRWLRQGEVPTLGNWFEAAGYDTHYDGKWHLSHADLLDASTGAPLATNDDDGTVDPQAVEAYLEADPLAPHGFHGWVGPEPHGGLLANSGARRDPLIAARTVAWLTDRYARRRAGDEAALRPFLLVASFVNPHDIVLFPVWLRRGGPLEPGLGDPPDVPAPPTADEDLSTKPPTHAAFRDAYPSAYGPRRNVAAIYRDHAQEYRNLYHRLHAEVDRPLDLVRRAVTDGGSDHAVLVRTSDHGELLGAHGGLHQKWYQLYEEATRVPFALARIGDGASSAATVDGQVTSHVDLVPTLLAAAGIDVAEAAERLRATHSEVHELPGRDLTPLLADPGAVDPERTVYLMTRDHILDGDTGANALARALGQTTELNDDLRIHTPTTVATNVEGVVGRVDGRWWKLVRTFDDPALWSEPGARHHLGDGEFRTEPLDDHWELYQLDDDPIEAHNRVHDDGTADVVAVLRRRLEHLRRSSVPDRNEPWPYTTRPMARGGAR